MAKHAEPSDDVDVAWRLDASISGASHGPFIETPAAQRMLERGRLAVIVAPKGVGKTLLLQHKSQKLRESYEDQAVFIPKTELVDKLASLPLSLSKERVALLSLRDTWRNLWSVSFSIAVLYRTAQEPFTRSVAKLFRIENELLREPGARRPLLVKEILTKLIEGPMSDYRHLYNSELEWRLSQLQMPTFLFIDGIDEAFGKHAGAVAFAGGGDPASFDEGALDPKVWISSQLGLLGAIRDLQLRARKLRIYATLRSEAYQTNRDALALQESDFCIELETSKQLAEEMFIANIEVMVDSDLSEPRASDPYRRFVGLTHISRVGAAEEEGIEASEGLFDFIYRHTFGRPRELMHIGKALAKMPKDERTDAAIRKKVRTLSVELLNEYKNQMIPPWDSNYDRLLGSIKSNVLPESVVIDCFNEFKELSHPFSYFINRGLIGWLEYDEDQAADIIRFRRVGGAIGNHITEEGRSKNYFLHPSLACQANVVADCRAPVGADYPWPFDDDYDVLEVTPGADRRFKIRLRRNLMTDFSRLDEWPTPLFIGIVSAVAQKKQASVSCGEVIQSLDDIVSRFNGHHEHILAACQKVSRWFGSDQPELSDGAARALSALNRVMHVEDGAAAAGQPTPFEWRAGVFTFNVCPPERVRVHKLRRNRG